MTETQREKLDRRQGSRNETLEILDETDLVFSFLTCIYFCYLYTEDYGLKMGPSTVEIPAFVEYLLKLVNNVRLKCFGAHWAASNRHGPLFTQQCYSPTRCYGKFGSHKGLESSGEGIISAGSQRRSF